MCVRLSEVKWSLWVFAIRRVIKGSDMTERPSASCTFIAATQAAALRCHSK